MATTFSNLNEALVDQTVVEAARQALPYLKLFSHVVDSEEKTVNDVVRVPLQADPSVGDKTAGSYQNDDGSLTGVNVTLSRYRAATWTAKEGVTPASVFESFWLSSLRGAVYQVVKDVIDAALALITSTNFGNTDADELESAVSSFDQEALAQLWAKGIAKAKNQARVIMLNTEYAAQLYGNTNLGLVYATGGQNFVASGRLPQFIGIDLVHYADFPANSENLAGAVIGSSALAVAVARPSTFLQSGDADIVERRVIADPETGLSVLYTVSGSGAGLKRGEIALLSGVAKGNNAIVRLVKTGAGS